MIRIRYIHAVLQGVLLCGLVFCGTSPAQQSDPAAGNDESRAGETIEEIVVTGSRIPRRTSELPTPTTVIDSEILERSGTTNLGDVMHEYPALIDGIGSNGNNDQSTGSFVNAGQELLNLRGLGVDRTLVLVNGRRHVPGDSETTSVDISMIPTPLIERVEVITGGASAIYGADAVTGVVNIILKDDFEGVQIDVLGGISTESDGELVDINVTVGQNFADGRGNFFASLNYTDESEIPVVARPFSNRNPDFLANPDNTGPDDGIPDQIFVDDVRFTPLNAEGTLNLVNNAGTNMVLPIQEVAFFLPLFPDDPIGLVFDPALSDGLLPGQALYDSFTIDRTSGEVRPFDSGANCDFIACSGGDGFRTAETNTLSSPLQRVVVNLGGHYDFNPLTLHISGKYGRVESQATGQGFVFHDGVFGPYIRIERDNPFLPPAMAAEMDARGLTAAPLAVVGLNALSANTRETFQVTLGGEGSFSDRTAFEFYGQYGEVDTELRLDDVLLSRYFQALDATTDAAGNAVCRDASNGCVPLNPFNRGASPESLAFVDAGLLATVNLTQVLFGFSMNGDGWELPAGNLQYAAGVEYRRESSESVPDELMQARDPVTGDGLGLVGITAGPTPELNTFFLPIRGNYSVGEVFGELLIPIVRDRTLLQSFDLDLAARYSEYDVTGSSVSYKTGLNWTLNDVFRFRSTLSRAVRAPNIGELFSPAAPGAQFVNDPCDASNLTAGRNPENRQANCAALGLPPDFQSFAQFSARTVTSQGNPELDEESADTVTIGAVITIGDNFNVAIDYWNIEIEDTIVRFFADRILENCVDGATLDPLFCSFVTRASDGQIVNIDRKDINAGLFKGSGIDLEGNYVHDFNNGSSLTFSLIGSYLDEITFLPSAADPDTQDKRADTANRPRIRALLSTVYDIADWQLGWDVTYIGSSKIFRDVQPEELSFNKVESKIYHSLDVRYRFDDRLEIFGGVRNLADEDPPAWMNFGGILYDGVGRYFFAGARFAYR